MNIEFSEKRKFFLVVFIRNGYSIFMNPEKKVLELFLNYSRMLSLTGSPKWKTAAAKWEIFFQNRLSELEVRSLDNRIIEPPSDTSPETNANSSN